MTTENTPPTTDPSAPAHAALARIQHKLVATKNKRNDFGGYQYRNKEGILEAVKPLLREEGATITLHDRLEMVGERYYIHTTAYFTLPGSPPVTAHGYAREAATKKGMDDAQITGATSSYAGKYALCNLLAIDDSADDPDATNDHDKRLPTPAELTRISAATTVDELVGTYKALLSAGCAKGYVADLCAYRKAQLLDQQPQREDLFPNTPETTNQTAYHD